MIILGVLVLLTLVAVGLTPRSTTVEGSELSIRSWLVRYRFNLDQLTGVEAVEAGSVGWSNTLRVCGVGWPLKPYGWFWNKRFGMMLALVSDKDRALLLKFPHRRLLASPPSRDALMPRPRAIPSSLP